MREGEKRVRAIERWQFHVVLFPDESSVRAIPSSAVSDGRHGGVDAQSWWRSKRKPYNIYYITARMSVPLNGAPLAGGT